MSVLTVIIYVTVTTTAVLYSGATALETIFGISLPVAIAVICGIAIGYVLWGGLLAAVWADLFQGSALLVGGLVTLGLGLAAVGGPGAFLQANADRLHMILPRSHPELPWTVLVGGMWIPIFYYCGLNQFITQRTLAARSLGQGQAGIVLAAALWLLVPFAIVMPGAIAHQLYGAALERPDQAYPMLIRELVPTGPARLHPRRPRRRRHQHARLGPQLGLDDLHDGPLPPLLPEGRRARRSSCASAA